MYGLQPPAALWFIAGPCVTQAPALVAGRDRQMIDGARTVQPFELDVTHLQR